MVAQSTRLTLKLLIEIRSVTIWTSFFVLKSNKYSLASCIIFLWNVFLCAMGTNNNFGSFIVVIISSSYYSVPFSQYSCFLFYINILSFRPVFQTYFVKHALSERDHKKNTKMIFMFLKSSGFLIYEFILLYSRQCIHSSANMNGWTW